MKKIRSDFTFRLLKIELQSTSLTWLSSKYSFVPSFVFLILNLKEFLKKNKRLRRVLNSKENNYIINISVQINMNTKGKKRVDSEGCQNLKMPQEIMV